MKRLVPKFFLFVPILALVAGLNYSMDPGNLFDQEAKSHMIATRLIAGGNVANALFCDSGIWHRLYVEGIDRKEIVVLGSSRSVNIHAAMFPGLSFVNLSSKSARLGDLIATYQLLRTRNQVPSRIILEVDPWTVDDTQNYLFYRSLQSEFSQAAELLKFEGNPGLPGAEWIPRDYIELVSPAYFQKSLAIAVKNNKKTNCYPTDLAYGASAVTLPDGSANWGSESPDNPIDDVETRRLAEEFLATLLPENDPSLVISLDHTATRLFQSFIELLVRDRVQVTLLLVPYHPVAFQSLARAERYPILLQSQEFYESIARQHQLNLIGSYNPADCGLGASAFFDGLHMRAGSLRQILERCRHAS